MYATEMLFCNSPSPSKQKIWIAVWNGNLISQIRHYTAISQSNSAFNSFIMLLSSSRFMYIPCVYNSLTWIHCLRICHAILGFSERYGYNGNRSIFWNAMLLLLLWLDCVSWNENCDYFRRFLIYSSYPDPKKL